MSDAPNERSTPDPAARTGKEPLELDRRNFLKLLSFLTAAAATGGLASCGRCGRESSMHEPFAVWEEIRDALRSSPDHLPSRAEQLVAEADPARLFEFVRDEIATYPVSDLRIDGQTMRWGVRGTLRGGAGTPREKAELLAHLYRTAGWEAEVLDGSSVRPSPDDVKRMLDGATRPSFAPPITEREMGKWRRRLGLTRDAAPLQHIDEDGKASRALAERLDRALPSDGRTLRPFDWRLHGPTPIVRVHANGQTHHASLFEPGVGFDETAAKIDRLKAARAATLPDDVEVTLATATSSAPEDRIDLVTGTWNLGDLVGRQVLVQMLPGLDLRRQAVARFSDVQTFIPALAVQGFDLDRSEMEEMSVLGDAVTRRGDRIAVAPDGHVTVNGRALRGSPGAIDSVTALELELDPSNYPTIRMNASALDANGQQVEGLLASDFRLEENSEPASITLSSNRSAPRIMFLSDASGSMPPEYRGKGMEALVKSLTDRVKAEHPDATLIGQPTSSELWKWLTWAAGTDANLIIFATDGHVEGELTDQMRAILANAPPVVVINVRGYAEDNFWYKRTFAPMAEVTGATIFSIDDAAEAETAIVEYVRNLAPELRPYHLVYGSPSQGPGERTVTLSTADGRVSAKATYVAPAVRSSALQLCGLYLTVKVGSRSITRTLAGYDPARHHDAPVSDEMVNETLGACFGTHYLSFEAAAPPLSVWLDDFITAKLSIAPLDAALQRDANLDELEAIVQEGSRSLPSDLFLQALPLPEKQAGEPLTFEQGPRVMLHQTYPVFDTDYFKRTMDILPFTTFATAAAKPDEAFRLTMERTARFAVAEAELYPTSTASMLEGEKLVDYAAFRRLPELTHEQRSQWDRVVGRRMRYEIVPSDGDPYAFWHVHESTGSVLGILPDGTGGGSAEERLERQLKEIDRVLSMYNALILTMASMAGVTTIGGVALGIVAVYGQTLVRLYGAATLAITIMDASHIEESVESALENLACNVKKTIFTAAFGSWGETFSMLETLIGAIGGESPFACP